MGEVIDLCGSDEEEQRPQERQGRPAQRQRGSSGELTHWQAASGQDDEVEIVEEPSPRQQQQQQQQAEELDADLAVLAVSGDGASFAHSCSPALPWLTEAHAAGACGCSQAAPEALTAAVRA